MRRPFFIYEKFIPPIGPIRLPPDAHLRQQWVHLHLCPGPTQPWYGGGRHGLARASSTFPAAPSPTIIAPFESSFLGKRLHLRRWAQQTFWSARIELQHTSCPKKSDRANLSFFSVRGPFALYKYHFPFPTHELKIASLRERKYANWSLDCTNEKLRTLILNNSAGTSCRLPLRLSVLHTYASQTYFFPWSVHSPSEHRKCL